MKKMLIMLVCMLVNVLGFVVVEPKVEEAAVAESASRLAAIEVAVADKEVEKCLDIDNLSFFVSGMDVAEAEEAGLYDGEVVELARGEQFIEYGIVVFDYEDDYMTYVRESELESEIICNKTDAAGGCILTTIIATVAEAMFLVWFFVTKPEEEKEEAKREAWREAKRKLRNKNTREAIETIKEASIVIDNMVSNDMNSYFLEELYQDLETLYNEVVYNEVELDSIINVQVDMKNVIEYPHFMF